MPVVVANTRLLEKPRCLYVRGVGTAPTPTRTQLSSSQQEPTRKRDLEEDFVARGTTRKGARSPRASLRRFQSSRGGSTGAVKELVGRGFAGALTVAGEVDDVGRDGKRKKDRIE